ncbi:MAG TPA: YlxR family protein [Haloplasmataceae bacterium]
MKQKKIPMRKCVVSNANFPKKELIRIVKNNENQVFVDPTGKKNGRGAYIQLKKDIIDKAKKTKVLDKHLEIEIPDTIYDELYSLLKGE